MIPAEYAQMIKAARDEGRVQGRVETMEAHRREVLLLNALVAAQGMSLRCYRLGRGGDAIDDEIAASDELATFYREQAAVMRREVPR